MKLSLLLLAACNLDSSLPLAPDAPAPPPIEQQAYIKPSDTKANEAFSGVALSKDGATLAVGASFDNAMAGSVHVYVRSGEIWEHQALLVPSLPLAGAIFGSSLSVSNDGSIIVVGSPLKDGGTPGGSAYVFVRTGTSWQEQARLQGSNTEADDSFGFSVSISGDGTHLAIGARAEDSGSSVLGETDNSAEGAGAVYSFVRSGTTWTQDGYLKASNAAAGDNFGHAVAMSADARTLIVGAIREDSTNDSVMDAGAAYVFSHTTGVWVEETMLLPLNPGVDDLFGFSVSVTDNGQIAVVGTHHEDGDGELAPDSGAVFVFRKANNVWSQDSLLRASNAGHDDNFGVSTAISGDGSVLIVGARGEASSGAGFDADPGSDAAPTTGAVYLFAHDATWSQTAYIKASNPDGGDNFGGSVTLSGNSSTLAVGAPGEDSSAVLVNGNQDDEAATNSGAVYVFQRN